MAQNSTRVPVFSLGERIRKAREDRGLSQQQFADELGVDRKTLGSWENSRHKPARGDVMLISSVADVSFAWLAGDDFRPTSRSAVVGGCATGVANTYVDPSDIPGYSALMEALHASPAEVCAAAR